MVHSHSTEAETGHHPYTLLLLLSPSIMDHDSGHVHVSCLRVMGQGYVSWVITHVPYLLARVLVAPIVQSA